MAESIPKNGDLRVWWIPQIPMEPFYFPVASVEEGALILEALAQYDMFQLENRVKPDFSNVGGLQMFDAELDAEMPGDGWCDWEGDHGETLDEFMASAGQDTRIWAAGQYWKETGDLSRWQ